ncbi:MAG: Gfo/Idh/MocA family oxidoreductase [Planctomycetota bacterium]
MASRKGRKRYAIVGIGGRSVMYSDAILAEYSDRAELVGICDINEVRLDYANRCFAEQYGAKPVPTYGTEDFDRMIKERKVEVVIVTSIDRTHHRYIVRAMELGCDCITEKPMTVDGEKCQAIFDAIARTGRKLRVTFNYRYTPPATKVKELVMDGAVGEILSADMQWLLDTRHGADYFRRWHRDKRNSGGLLVHKATHHFDLMNWWLDSTPKTVFAMGDLRFYGRENAERRGVTKFYARAHGQPNAADDPFALHLAKDKRLKAMYLDAEKADGYCRDQSVFGDGISIEDVMAVMVRYTNGVIFTYALNAFCPWEGVRVALNGTKGRIELRDYHSSYISAQVGAEMADQITSSFEIMVHPHWKKPYRVEAPAVEGGHGGGDPRLLEDIFGTPAKDRTRRAADHLAGARSVLIGAAANRSMRLERPVDISSLVQL